MRLILILLFPLYLISCAGHDLSIEGDYSKENTDQPQAPDADQAPPENQNPPVAKDSPADQGSPAVQNPPANQNPPADQSQPLVPNPLPDQSQPASESTTCVNTQKIVCGYDLPLSEWVKDGTEITVKIPASKTLVTTIKTSDSTTQYGNIAFQTTVGGATPSTLGWISRTPGGAPLSDKCDFGSRGFIYSYRWQQYEYRSGCNLSPNQTYFLNMQHAYIRDDASYVIRHFRTVIP